MGSYSAEVMQEHDHDASSLAAGEPESGLGEQQDWPGETGSRREGLRSVVLRGATVLLDLLAWWPEAASAGQTCVAVLQIRQGADRE